MKTTVRAHERRAPSGRMEHVRQHQREIPGHDYGNRPNEVNFEDEEQEEKEEESEQPKSDEKPGAGGGDR